MATAPMVKVSPVAAVEAVEAEREATWEEETEEACPEAAPTVATREE